MILIYSYDKDGQAYVKTDQIDGETDWKARESIQYLQKMGDENIYDLYKEDWQVVVEKPSKELYDFQGQFRAPLKRQNLGLGLTHTLWANMTV